MDQTDSDVSILKIIAIAVTVCFMSLVTGITTCSIVVAPEKTKQAKQNVELEKKKQAAIQTLIDKGIDPLTARCTVMGWSNDDLICNTKNYERRAR